MSGINETGNLNAGYSSQYDERNGSHDNSYWTMKKEFYHILECRLCLNIDFNFIIPIFFSFPVVWIFLELIPFA